MGALVGGCYATNQLDTLEDWVRSLTRRRIISYLDVRIGGSGLISGGRLAHRLEESIGDAMIENLPIRFAAIATEIGTGHEVWLTRGSLVACGARVLCPARYFSARACRRPLAGRWRAGQSGAGLGRARVWRPRRYRRQHGRRPVRPRRHHRQPRRRPRRHPGRYRRPITYATALPACAAYSAPNARSSARSLPAIRDRVSRA